MKVLFVYAESEQGGFKPMGISLLSSILLKEGHDRLLFDTSIYDINIKGRVHEILTSEAQLVYPHVNMPDAAIKRISKDFALSFNETIENYKPDLVAFSTTSLMYVLVETLVRELKSKKRPKLAIGGIHALSYTDDLVSSGMFDYICYGEGENTIKEIVKHVAGEIEASDIPNIVVKIGGKYIKNKPSVIISNLDDLPFYDWSLYMDYHFWRPYQGSAYRMGDYQSSRGCPYKCLFCFYNTFYKANKEVKTIRFYSADRCISEMEELTKCYDLHFWKFHDSDFLLRPEKDFAELMGEYNKRIGLPFVCNTNANSISKEKAKLLKSANCKSVTLGLESGSERIRRQVLGKEVSNKKIIEAVSFLKNEGLRVCTSNMLGLPKETENDLRETISLNRIASPDLAEPSFFYPFKGTELGDNCYKNGFVKDHSSELVNLRTDYVMEMPQISNETLFGINRAFPLYMNLPEWLDQIIRLAERYDNTGHKVYQTLHHIVQNKINKRLDKKQ